MAQLSDDCFAFSGPLLPVVEMERLIYERVTPVAETEGVALLAAHGRVLAHDISAPLDLPPFDNSAVDGYAVRYGDLSAKGDTKLSITGRLTAGSLKRRTVGRARPSASSPAHRCRPGPTPYSCRKMFASKVKFIAPPG